MLILSEFRSSLQQLPVFGIKSGGGRAAAIVKKGRVLFWGEGFFQDYYTPQYAVQMEEAYRKLSKVTEGDPERAESAHNEEDEQCFVAKEVALSKDFFGILVAK